MGLYNLVRGFTGAYKRGAYIQGELKTRFKKKRFSITYIAVQTKKLFELTRFFKLQNVVKSRIHLMLLDCVCYCISWNLHSAILCLMCLEETTLK